MQFVLLSVAANNPVFLSRQMEELSFVKLHVKSNVYLHYYNETTRMVYNSQNPLFYPPGR